MKEKIINEVGKILPHLISDIKTICAYDSRRDAESNEHPYGKRVTECLNKALQLASNLGFEVENIDNQVGVVSYGPKTDEYIACVGHLDVVDINGAWKTDPFTCTEIDGTLYARGILDNKGPIFCCLYALKTLVDLKVKFPIQVKIIFGTNEETGMKDMEYYFKKHKYPLMGFTPDCKYPVVYAERGRASFDYKINTKYTEEFFDFINKYIMNQSDLSGSLGIDYSDDEFGKNQVRKTVLKSNGNDYILSLSLSYPASYHINEMEKSLEKNLSENMSLSLVENIDPVFFDKDSYLIKKLEEAYEEVMNEDGKAVTTTGGTYAKVIKNIVPFGPSFKGQKGIAHMPNEWMKICDIEKNCIIYAYALYKLMEDIDNA